MTSDQLIDLWVKAQKLSITQHPRSFLDLKIFADLVAEAEREACAIICEDFQDKPFSSHAALIRSRGAL
jgi:hypothetical protein